MDYIDKIMKFTTLESLEAAIIEDAASKDVLSQRYCVRFIMLNSFEVYQKLFDFLINQQNVAVFNIENLLSSDDTTISMDMLADAIRGIDKTTIVTPFSEIVRFYEEDIFRGFFNDIILTEDVYGDGKAHIHKRIYVPIIGLHNRFTDFLKNFGRIEESAPIWQYYLPQPDRVTVYVSKYRNVTIDEKLGIVQLATMRDWLKFWKKQAPKDKILCGAAPIRFSYKYAKPDSIFNFQVIDNANTFVNDFLSIKVPIKYVDDEAEYWDKLVMSIDQSEIGCFDFSNHVRRYFNRVSFSFRDILDIWADKTKSAFDRWLLKQYLFNSDLLDDKPYLKFCLDELTDFRMPVSLFNKIAERIFYITEKSVQDRYFEERRQLMTSEHFDFAQLVTKDVQAWIEKQILEIAHEEDSLKRAKKFCTGTFSFEKPMFMSWFVHRSKEDFGMEQLMEFYPDLYAYLRGTEPLTISPKQQWSLKYFDDYRWAKLSDTYTDAVRDSIATHNADEERFYQWYYSFTSCHELLNGRYVDKVYWFDGLGAEYLPFIHYVIESAKTDYEVIQSEFAVTGLPSNTSLNKFEVDNKKIFKIDAPDSIAHDQIYRQYTTLREELDAIKKEILDVLHSNLHSKQTIAFVSDHGLSALSRLCESKKLNGDFQHEGRYEEAKEGAISDTDYIVCQNEVDNKRYKVALKHASLGSRPTHEVHGGCTPEEVIVPFVVISNIDNSKLTKYVIELKTPSVAISDSVVRLIVMPQPKSVALVFDGKRYNMTPKGVEWTVKLDNPKAGKHTMQVTPEHGLSKNIDIEFYGMGFDSSFNDFDNF